MTKPHDIAAAVRAELAVPGRYRLHAPAVAAHSSWWQIAGRWIAGRWDAFWRHVPHVRLGAHSESIAGDLIVVSCVLVVGVTAARLLMALQAGRERAGRIAGTGAPARSAHALFVRAAAAAEHGAYTEAVRLLFAAAIVLLDLRGVVAAERSATINELRHALRVRDAEAEAPFAEIAHAFTDAAYAERPVDAARWERASDAYRLLMERARA